MGGDGALSFSAGISLNVIRAFAVVTVTLLGGFACLWIGYWIVDKYSPDLRHPPNPSREFRELVNQVESILKSEESPFSLLSRQE